MHLDTYADYLRQVEPRTESRAVRALLTTGGPRMKKLHGRYLEVYGPYQIMLNVDGISIYTRTYITTDDDQMGQIYLGEEELKVRRIGHDAMMEQDAVHIGYEADVTAHLLDTNGTKIGVTGLLDTGAVVSVMPIKTWERMGFTREDLIPTNLRLAAANRGAIYVAGRTPVTVLHMGGRNLWMSFLVVENLDDADQFILGRDFVRNFDVMIDLNNGLIRIRNPDRKYVKRPINRIITDENKVPVFLDRKVKLQPGQAVVAIFRMRNLNSLSDSKQFCLVPNPNSQSSVILGRSFSVTRNGLCVSVLLNTLDTTVSIQRGKKLGYALPMRTDYEETQNLKKYSVKDCPYHANKDKILKRFDELKSIHKLFSMKSETDDGLSSCSNFPERPSSYELESDKPVLPEIEHLKGKIGEGDFEKLRDLLNRNADVFSKHKADIGCCNFVEHEIELEEGAVPHREGARRMTPQKSEACRAEIEMLLEYDMIEPSKSPWACGVVMAKKKGGQLRFCCDFRYLNAVTIKDAYPIPRIDESLSKLGDAKFFTTLDLGSAFWQVPLRKKDREKTGFACELGLYQWKRMPFGLCNATATFQRLMAQALTRVTKKYGNLVMCYVDDVVIATPTLEDHIDRLSEVFGCMKRAGLKWKPSKCEILRDSIKYLGRMVDRHGVRPDPEAVEAVLTWKAPRTDTQLLVETRARNMDREVYQDPDSDRYLIPSERVFDNAADDLETIAVSKRSISLLPQKAVVRTDLLPFEQETQPLAKIWCVKMEEDTHQPNELNSQMRVMKTYLKARYRLSDLLRAQRNDRMTSNLKRWIENVSPDKGDLEEDSYRILRQYFMQKEGRLYLNKDGIVACKRREEDRVLYKYNAIVLPQLYQTELLFRSHDQMGHQGIDKVYQRILKRFEWPGMKKACEKWVTACLSCQQVKDPRKLRFPLQSIESSEFNEVVQIDHQKICMTDNGYNQVLVMIDHFTKYAEAVPCITASAEETCDHLINTWIARHGCPMTFQSDNGTAFVGELTKELMRRSQVAQAHSTTYHPQTNGLVERQNRTLVSMLRVYCSRYMTDWDRYLPQVMGAYNSTQHSTTGVSPHMMLTGHEKSLPLTFFYPEYEGKKTSPQVYVRDVIRRQQELNDLCRRNTQQAQARQRKRFDKKAAGAKGLLGGRLRMDISERYTTERDKEASKEVEGTLHDYRGAPRGTLLQTEYWPSRPLREHQATQSVDRRLVYTCRHGRRGLSNDGSCL